MRTATGTWVATLLLCGTSLAQPTRRVLLIDIDGLGRETFAKAYAEHKLPAFERAFGNAVWFDNASTVMPSVTMAAQASIITGTPPSKHGIVGNQWYEREGKHFFDYMNLNGISCVYGFTILGGPGCAAGLGNRHLQQPTIYEVAAEAGLSSIVVYNPYWKGATRPAPPTIPEAASFLKSNMVNHRLFDARMAARAINELQTNGLPSILTLYFAGADLAAHDQGIVAQIPYLEQVIDPLLDRVLDKIEQLDPDWRNRTLCFVTSDHGRSDVTPHPEDEGLIDKIMAALPPGSRMAVSGPVGYVYATGPVELGMMSPSIASVRKRTAEESPRMGDVIITLREGHYFGNPATGSYPGSASPSDVGVPLVVAIPSVAQRRVNEPVSTTQIARTIADYLGFPMPTADPALPLRKRAMSNTTASSR